MNMVSIEIPMVREIVKTIGRIADNAKVNQLASHFKLEQLMRIKSKLESTKDFTESKSSTDLVWNILNKSFNYN